MEAPPQLNRFEFANRIFTDALSLRPEQRTAFVRERCARDPVIADSVLRLLAQFGDLGDFLENPVSLSASARTLTEGCVLCRRFRILEQIGTGGMGEVLRAQDQVLGEVVALKTIRGDLRSDSVMFTRFCEEIRLARRISHPNVCKIFDLFTDAEMESEPIDFFTMQYLSGETLAGRIATGPLHPDETLRLATEIARGLDA